MHPVLKSGIVHYEFVRIHPFVDGNGRVSRALSTFILFQEGYDIRKFFSLEEYFDNEAASTILLCKVSSVMTVISQNGWSIIPRDWRLNSRRLRRRLKRFRSMAISNSASAVQPIMFLTGRLRSLNTSRRLDYLQNKAFKRFSHGI